MRIHCDEQRIGKLKRDALERRAAHQTYERLSSTYFLDTFLAHQDQPPLLREALALEARYACQDIPIYPGELIVGREAREAFDLDFLDGIRLAEDALPPNRRAQLAVAREHVTRRRIAAHLGPAEWAAMESGLAATTFMSGHMILDLDWLLRAGLEGVGEAVEARERFGAGLDPAFYAAMRATVRAMEALIARYAERARSLAQAEADPQRREELDGIAQACEWVSRRPPRSFHEALQLAWLVHVMNGCDSLGRLDQYLWRFYERDLGEGRLTRDEAGYLLQCVWCKVLEGFSIQNLTLGGTDADGEDAANDLTYLCLETTRRLRTPQPNLSLRLPPDPPERLLAAALETIALGLGVPALYNDGVIVPALQRLGIPAIDARGYALAGCSQVVIPGKSHFLCDDGVLNAAKCLELALCDGADLRTGRQVGPRTGAVETFAGFDQVLAAFYRQVEYAAEALGRCLDTSDRTFAGSCGQPVRTLLMQSCLARGLGILQGGATYNAAQAECVGITNAADSLAAIRRLVFEDGACSLPELVAALRRDWSGHEALAQQCRNRSPRFGNDDDAVDGLYREIAETVYRAVGRQRCWRGGSIIPGSVIYTYHTEYGALTGATPDGRHSGAPLADSAGPSQGAARRGPTAIVNSLAKVDQSLAPTCVVLNLMLARNTFEAGKLAALVESYFARGGMQVQINVADREVLQRARERPEEYRDLTVRVGGYSAYFVELPAELQEEIITRC